MDRYNKVRLIARTMLVNWLVLTLAGKVLWLAFLAALWVLQ